MRAASPTLLLMMSAPGRFGGESTLPEAEIALCLEAALVHAAPAIAAPAAWLLTLATQPAASITFKADSGCAGPWGLVHSSRTEALEAHLCCIDVSSAQACDWKPTAWQCMLARTQANVLAQP